VFKQIKPTPEADLRFLEMARLDGYPVFSKFIDTPDGYILNIFRIPGPRSESLGEAL
jgi:hypothetical protein